MFSLFCISPHLVLLESEDDLHQCGRCMEIFHNISDYFDHKKKKSCGRVRLETDKREHAGKLGHANDATTFGNVVKVSETANRLVNVRESQTKFADESCNRTPSENITPVVGNEVNESANDYATRGFSHTILTLPSTQGMCTSSEVNEHAAAAEGNSYTAQTVNSVSEQFSQEVESQRSSVTYEKAGATEESVALPRWRRGRPPKSMTYSKIVQLKKPMHWNSKPRLHQCPKCSYIASFKDDYDRHLRKSHNLSAYVCYRCQKAFSDKYKLKRHLQRLCRREPPQSKAPAFIEFSKKTNHMAFNCHAGEEVLQVIKKVCFSCQLCIDLFDSYSAILLHMVKHPNVRPGICKFCGMWFANRYKLRRHVVSSIHDDVADEQMLAFRKEVEKMKIVCPAGVIKSKLKRHMVTCSKCHQVFVDQVTLLNHRESAHQRNTRGKSYFCKLCSTDFESRTKYLLHLKTSHQPATRCTEFPSRQCPVCQRKFQHLSHTNRHRMALHTAHPQVPLSVISELLTDAAVVTEVSRGNSLADEHARECAEKSKSSAGSFICFVCCLRFVNKDLAREHIECHRVWLPHPTDGPVPADLFDPAFTVPPIQVLAEASSRNVKETEEHSRSETVGTTSVNHAEGIGITNCVSNDKNLSKKDSPTDIVPTSNNVHLNSTDSLFCPYCQKEYSNLQSLYQHKTDDHKLICIFRCIISSCNLNFETADKYQAHSNVHSQFAFICKVCNEHFRDKQDLFSHRLSAHRHVHPVSNSILKMRSRSSNTKKQSQIIQTCQEQQSLSNIEPLEKLQQSGLKSENVQKVDERLCDQCGCTFNKKAGLCHHHHHHSAPSTTSRQYVCEVCSKAFNKKEHLQRHHISAHTVAKPFVCKEPGCGKAFKRKDKLQDHFKCHSSIKPYSCSVCGRKYRYREGLRYHERMHEKELRYRCSNCSISFPRPSELRQHLSSAHKLESKKEIYAYHCNICNRAFPRPERLKRHSERDHNILANWVFRCDVCCKGFAGIKSYETHMIRHHNSTEDNGQSCAKQRKCKSKQNKLAKKLPKDGEISGTALPALKWNEEQSSSSDLHPDSSSDSVGAIENCHMPDTMTMTPVANDTFYAPSSPRSNAFPRNHVSEVLTSHEAKGEKVYSQTGFTSLPSESHDRRFTGYSYTQPSEYNVADYGNSTGNGCCTIANHEEPQYDSLPDLEADTASESNRILRCGSDQFSPVPPVSLSNASSTLSYPGYPSSRISQPSSGLHSSLGFYHPGANAYRSGANGYPFPAEEFPSAPLPFSFARANTFTHVNNKMTAKASDLTAGSVSAQLSFSDHASVPFRPVAMPTQHTKPPTANPYANETRFGRWFGNVPLLTNSYDAKQTMLDAVRFSRLPASDRAATASHPFSMPCHDPYMTSRYSAERQGIPREASGNIDQRSVFMDYNFMSDDHTTIRRDEHFSHSGASALHPVSTHVPGSMPPMHVSLSLLSQQQQQFPVNDYQWPTMPMYNWL